MGEWRLPNVTEVALSILESITGTQKRLLGAFRALNRLQIQPSSMHFSGFLNTGGQLQAEVDGTLSGNLCKRGWKPKSSPGSLAILRGFVPSAWPHQRVQRTNN